MKKQLIIILLLFCLKASSQSAVTNNGNLQIHSSGALTVFGNFTNATTASLLNNGSIYAKASFTNDQTLMNAGAGSLIFNGSSIQTINGTQPLKTFNLTTDNIAGITLNNNLHVTGSHTFSNGVLTTSASNFLVYEAGSSYTGASDAAHVNGWVKKMGSTNFTFPTGNATYLREVAISDLSPNSEFDAQYNGVIPPSYRVLESPLSSINPNEFWTINRSSGGTANITLNWNTAKVPFPNYVVADLRTAWLSGNNSWVNTGGTATGNTNTIGSITSDVITTFGRFAIANTSTALPLRFLGINAVRENALVKVTWQTANEIAVNFHEVQRSSDGINFTTIGNVSAKNSDFQSYSFIDRNSPPTKLFYRIREIDLDGSIRYSRIATVSSTGQSDYIELVQNPVRSEIKLAIRAGTASIYFYQLINSAGQVCEKGSFESNGTLLTSIPLSVQPGEYTLVVANSKNQQQFKLIVL